MLAHSFHLHQFQSLPPTKASNLNHAENLFLACNRFGSLLNTASLSDQTKIVKRRRAAGNMAVATDKSKIAALNSVFIWVSLKHANWRIAYMLLEETESESETTFKTQERSLVAPCTCIIGTLPQKTYSL